MTIDIDYDTLIAYAGYDGHLTQTVFRGIEPLFTPFEPQYIEPLRIRYPNGYDDVPTERLLFRGRITID